MQIIFDTDICSVVMATILLPTLRILLKEKQKWLDSFAPFSGMIVTKWITLIRLNGEDTDWLFAADSAIVSIHFELYEIIKHYMYSVLLNDF